MVELTQLVAGPLCGRLLVSLGAEVLKIEPPGGEVARRLPPFVAGTSMIHRYANAGKRIVELDLRSEEDRKRLLEAISESDVFVENVTRSTLSRVGIDEEPPGPRSHPGLRVSIRATGSGSGGPLRAVDPTIQAASGLMWINGDDRGPRRFPMPVVDVLTATLAALEVSADVAAGRHRTGWSSVVSMMAAATLLQGPLLLAAALGVPVRPLDGTSPFVAPGAPFVTADGHVAVSVLDDARWGALCVALGVDDAERAAFESSEARLADQPAVFAVVQDKIAGRTVREAAALLEQAGVPCEPVRTYEQVLSDQEIAAYLRTGEGPDSAEVVMPVGATFSASGEVPA